MSFFALFGPPGGHLKPLGRLLAALRIPGPPQDPFFNNFLRIWSRALLKTLPFLCKPRTMLHTLAAQCPELVQNPGAAVHRLACSISLVRVSKGNFIRLRHGAADFKGFALPPTLFRLELQVSSLDVPVGTWDVENGV